MTTTRPHFTFWVVAGFGLLWNLMGCLNYLSQTDPAAVAQMPEVYQVIIAGRPIWATAGFAIAVFGGAVGCILLLLRRRVAVPVFVLSLCGIALTSVFTLMIVGIIPAMVLSVLVGGALLWYGFLARRFGWLR